ncbi:MAG TPA: RodZ domain-containing protein [Allosphingosinicella sp.]|jgi:hypothetical protein|nr:RodZ domain-containing protein [Allosphingosinicella sp.]
MVVDDRERARAAVTAGRLQPVGFWSYARQDDQLAAGRLSALRALLMQELQQQYGREPIRLFQDANTIPHGADWEKEIRKALDIATFFIPIVTPNFVQSEWCCREVELFMERERQLGALHPELADTSRIFPILFIGVDDVDPENPEVLAALQKLQWFDFRPHRHRDFGEAGVREALSDLAGTMRSLLRRKVAPPAADPPPAPPPLPAEPTAEAPAPTVVLPVPAAAEPPPAPPRAAARPIEVGDVLNHIFEVKRFIKAGGMGQVFEGSNIITGERVAIKALLPALAADPKVIEMLQRESMTLTRLQHEALVQYRMLAKEPDLGVLYIATEYLDGVDLGDVLDKVDRSPEALAALLRRLASGLAAAHRLGAVHRDISPDNVMLPGGDLEQAKIIDFGIAKDLGGSLPTIIGGGFAGKLNFVAPEQLGEHKGEIGSWTDVYSLGLVILSVAKGEKVDMAGSFADAIRKRRDGVDLSAAPASLRPLLADMLRVDPAERLRTMEEVLVRLAGTASAEAVAPARRRKTQPAKAKPVAEPDREAEPVRDAPEARTEAPAASSDAAGSWLRPAWIAAGLALLVVVLWLLSGRSRPPDAPAAAPPQAGGAGAAPAATGRTVTLTAVGDVWIRVNDGEGGPQLFAGALTQGQTYSLPATARRPVLTTSRPQMLRASAGGRDFGALSGREEAVTNLSLLPENLAARAGAIPVTYDRSWLNGRWCVMNSRTGAPTSDAITFSGDRTSLRSVLAGTPDEEDIREVGEDFIRTNAGTYRRVAGGRAVNYQSNDTSQAPVTFGICQ